LLKEAEMASNIHHQSRGALRRLIDSLDLVFCKLNRIQFEAPWNPRRQGC